MAAVYTTLNEAKAFLRVDFSDDDTLIAGIQEMAEQYLLNELSGTYTGEGTVATVATTALAGTGTNFADFQVGDTIMVDGETDRTIATITDDDTLTVGVAFANTASGKTWKIKTSMPLVGAALPLPLKHALLMLIEHFYSIRGPVMVGVSVTKVPMTVEALIAPYRNRTIA